MEKSGGSKKPCAFCGIAASDVDAKIVFEDSVSIAFLDSRPLFPGHCLLITKAHYDTFADLPAELVGPVFSNAQNLIHVGTLKTFLLIELFACPRRAHKQLANGQRRQG